jgi:hypothetical protein
LILYQKGEIMPAIAFSSQADFYREFLVARKSFVPQDFGVDMEREAFDDQTVDFFGSIYKGNLTIDELLLHPAEAMRFCSDYRRKHGYFDLPDDIILRVILQRRKNPGA